MKERCHLNFEEINQAVGFQSGLRQIGKAEKFMFPSVIIQLWTLYRNW